MGLGYEHSVGSQLSCCIVVWGGAGSSTGDVGGSAGGFTEGCFMSSLWFWRNVACILKQLQCKRVVCQW